MLEHEFDTVINIFEKACATEDYGRGVGACRFFDVKSIVDLVGLLGDNADGYIKPKETEYPSMSLSVDDIGNLCKLILRNELFNGRAST